MKLMSQNICADFQICRCKFLFCAYMFVCVKFIEYTFVNKILPALRIQKLQVKIIISGEM